ncbi:GNAT family N-acetyltransferase [Kribbella deserti]|uniref:Lysine N-acyltransferase MbtK n=1 Tax=Kribbella deserti TaxID=1926257 RepID=A0ABV6QWP1_9ACTN
MTRAAALPEPDFRHYVAGVGSLGLRPFDLDQHTELLHSWVTQPYAKYWGLLTASIADVRAEYERIERSAHHEAFIGLHDGEPAFLMERYAPAHDPVGQTYEPLPGDVGMHVLVGPAEQPIAGFTTAVFGTIMEFLFSDPAVDRVVVEPDVHNTKIHALNDRMGFRKDSIVELPGDKKAWLSFCTREQYLNAVRMNEAG